MKRLFSTLSVICVLTTATVIEAQAQVSVSVNIGAQPNWGPVVYDAVEYYYLPDIECYYHVPRRQFVYLSGANWVFSANLPSRYRGYDLYNGYKVVCNEPRAYTHFSHHQVAYSRYRGCRGQQQVWRDHRGGGRHHGYDRGPRGDYGRHHGHGRVHGHGHDRGHGHGRW
jgi:hypothetical protein